MNVNATNIKERARLPRQAARGFASLRPQVDLIGLEFPRIRAGQTVNQSQMIADQAWFNRTSAQC